MPRITFMLGLAGSGKSHLADEICRATGAVFFESTYGPGPNAVTKSRMILHAQRGGDCVIEEIAYCMPRNREAVIAELAATIPNLSIQWVCFENDLESANWNVVHRTNKRDPAGHLRINSYYHGLYIYPDGAVLRPITRVHANAPAGR